MSDMVRENDFGRMLDFLQESDEEKTEPKESKQVNETIEDTVVKRILGTAGYTAEDYHINIGGEIVPYDEDKAPGMVKVLNSAPDLPSGKEAHYDEKDNRVVLCKKSSKESKQTNEKEEPKEDEETPQTMKPREKPDINAEDSHMEDYSEEDLEKIKDEPPIEGPAMTEVPEEEMVQDPEKLYSSKEKGLYLCNKCCKTFSGKESICIHCKSKDTELITEGRGADVPFTKEVYQVWYKDKTTGKEDSTRVMAFDEADAKKVAKKLDREIIRAKKIKEGKIPDDKDSEQKKIDKLTEGVSELIGEVTGIDTKDQGILQWALDNGFIDEEWPSDEVMIDALSAADVKPEEDKSMDLRAHYLFYILLLKAKQAHRDYVKARESKEVNEGYEIVKGQEFLYAGAPYKIVDFDADIVTAVRTDLPEEKKVNWSRKGLEMMFANPEEHGIGESKVNEAMKDWQCQECGYRFDKVVPRSGEMKCPKCGSYDIDVDTGTAESKVNEDERLFLSSVVTFIANWLDRHGETVENLPRAEIIYMFTEDFQKALNTQLKVKDIGESKVEEKLPDGTKFKFNYGTAESPEKVMKDLAGTDMLKSAMVGSKVTLVGPRGTPAVYAKDEDKEWKPWILGGKVLLRKVGEGSDFSNLFNEVADYLDSIGKGFKEDELNSALYTADDTEREKLRIATKSGNKSRVLGILARIGVVESKVKEAEDTFRTVAKGIEDRSTADEVARREKGQVVADEENSEKWMVIVKEAKE